MTLQMFKIWLKQMFAKTNSSQHKTFSKFWPYLGNGHNRGGCNMNKLLQLYVDICGMCILPVCMYTPTVKKIMY